MRGMSSACVRWCVHGSPEDARLQGMAVPGPQTDRPIANATEQHRGGVYLIVGAGLTKIGVTNRIDDRIEAIQAMCPVPLELVWTVEGNHATEAVLHAEFADCRRHGEWFSLPEGWETRAEQALCSAGVERSAIYVHYPGTERSRRKRFESAARRSAAEIGVDQRTLRDALLAGELTSTQKGDVERWIRAHTRPPRAS